MRLVCLFVALTLASPAIRVFAADLPEITRRGHMVAATSGNLPPVSFLNDKNELVGYDIEVGKFIARHIGVKLDLVRLDWKGILPGLQTGRFDAVFSNVNVTPERKEIFDYSIPYSRSAVSEGPDGGRHLGRDGRRDPGPGHREGARRVQGLQGLRGLRRDVR